MGISVFPAAGGGGFKKYSQVFNSSSTWTAPAGVTLVDVLMAGGGGGGGGGLMTATTGTRYEIGGGGGGAQVVRQSVPVTPGTTYSVQVGAGGAGFTGSSTSNWTLAQYGGISSFGYTYTLENGIFNGEQEFSNVGWQGGTDTTHGTISTLPTYPNYTSGDLRASSVSTAANTSGPTISGLSFNGITRRFTLSSINSGTYGDIVQWVPVTGSTQYTASGYFVPNTNSSIIGGVAISWYTGFNSTLISSATTSGTSISNNSAWQRLSTTATSPSNATYALVRFQALGVGGANQMNFTGLQFQAGASVTSYKSILTSGLDWIPNIGLVTTLTGAAAGGGGGGYSNEIQGFNYSMFTGFGGGGSIFGSLTDGGSVYAAGHGNGAGGPPTPHIPITKVNGTVTGDPSIQYSNFGYETVPPQYGAGSNMLRVNASIWHIILGNPGLATPEGLGAGGRGAMQGSNLHTSFMGSYGSAKSTTNYGTPSPGTNGLPNTGAGGAGGFVAVSGTTPGVAYGGSGGSGVVNLSWLGQ
jgi:hypothetical protein